MKEEIYSRIETAMAQAIATLYRKKFLRPPCPKSHGDRLDDAG